MLQRIETAVDAALIATFVAVCLALGILAAVGH